MDYKVQLISTEQHTLQYTVFDKLSLKHCADGHLANAVGAGVFCS